MIIIVGLGNPEKKYNGTRHNIGFEIIDSLAKKLGAEFRLSEKFIAEIAETTIQLKTKRVRTVLVKPQTYMNLSGDAVSKIVNFYKVRPQDQLWVIHDDLDINLGTIRIRLKGSSAGQKGIGSIIERLGTDEFIRFRIGIKPPEGPALDSSSGRQLKPAEQFVLEKFRPNEKKIIEEEINETVNILIESIDKGIIKTSL